MGRQCSQAADLSERWRSSWEELVGVGESLAGQTERCEGKQQVQQLGGQRLSFAEWHDRQAGVLWLHHPRLRPDQAHQRSDQSQVRADPAR